jgi:N-acetyl-anhydromuramyl-L-alanine amidase AmpD
MRRRATTARGAPVANWGKLREARQGVCLHYDGSASDAGAVAWLTKDPRARVSYNRLVLDDGQVVKIAPDDARAWHAGTCRPSSAAFTYGDANSALYGVALAAKPGDEVTGKQFDALVNVVRHYFEVEGWPLTDWWRVTDHEQEAWPRGRKVDIGRQLRHRGHPLHLDAVRQALTFCPG